MISFRSLCGVALAVTSLGFAGRGAGTESAPEVRILPSVQLSVRGHKITAEVAATMADRATGLMYRFSLQPDHGMVFVFARSEPLGFWMKNTFVPLSIAFIDSSGRILNIEDMAPRTEETHWSSGPAQYALEMRKGWFREHGVVAGDRVEGLPRAGRE